MQAAIDSMTRSLALEWGYYGIRVSGIAPGWIGDTTGMTTNKRHTQNINISSHSNNINITVCSASVSAQITGCLLARRGICDATWLLKQGDCEGYGQCANATCHALSAL